MDRKNQADHPNSNILSIDTDFEDNAYAYDKLDRVVSDAIDLNSPIGFNTGYLAPGSRKLLRQGDSSKVEFPGARPQPALCQDPGGDREQRH